MDMYSLFFINDRRSKSNTPRWWSMDILYTFSKTDWFALILQINEGKVLHLQQLIKINNDNYVKLFNAPLNQNTTY